MSLLRSDVGISGTDPMIRQGYFEYDKEMIEERITIFLIKFTGYALKGYNKR